MNSHGGSTGRSNGARRSSTEPHGELVTSVSSSYWSRTATRVAEPIHTLDGKGQEPRHLLSTKDSMVILQRENERLQWAKKCKVCFSADVEILFLPCRHLVCCETCEPSVDDCPLSTCGKHILGHVRVYLC